MQVQVTIDCTPQEARAFFGLPDVEPVQRAVMAELERRMVESLDRFSPEAVMTRWMSYGPFAENFMSMMNPGGMNSGPMNPGAGAPSPSKPADRRDEKA